MTLVAEIRVAAHGASSTPVRLEPLSRAELGRARSLVIIHYPGSGDAAPFPRDGREAAATDVMRELRGLPPRFAKWRGQRREYLAARAALVRLIADALVTESVPRAD